MKLLKSTKPQINDIVFEPMTSDDLEAVTQFARDNKAGMALCGLEIETRAQFQSWIQSKEDFFYLAKKGSILLAIGGFTFSKRAAKDETIAAVFYVTDELYRRNGIAKEMVKHLGKEIFEKFPSRKTIALQALQENQASISVGLSLGFKRDVYCDYWLKWNKSEKHLVGFSATTNHIAKMTGSKLEKRLESLEI